MAYFWPNYKSFLSDSLGRIDNVQGLMLAVRLGRAAVLHDTDHGVVLYNLSAVIPWIDVAVPARLGWPTVSTLVIATDHR